MSGQTKPTIVFAHGLWADGSCYNRVVAHLLADGFQVISTQNHLNTVADDAAAVRTSFARAGGPVVLVGHSYGGAVITAAGADERVAALVYICAFAPEEGDTTLVDQNKYPDARLQTHRNCGWTDLAAPVRRPRIRRRLAGGGAATRLVRSDGAFRRSL